MTDRDRQRVVRLSDRRQVHPDEALRFGRASWVPPDEPAWRPDGLAVSAAFWRSSQDPLEGTRAVDLFSYPVAGGPPQLLAANNLGEDGNGMRMRSVRWRADGRMTAWVLEGTGGSTLIGLGAPGRGDAAVFGVRSDLGKDADLPEWSHRGGLLACRQGLLRAPTANRTETVRVIEPAGRQARHVASFTPSSWREDDRVLGRALAFPDPRICALRWAPDDDTLALVVSPDATDVTRGEVWLGDPKGGRPPRRVSPRDGCGYWAPCWITGAGLGAIRVARDRLPALVLLRDGRAPLNLFSLPSTDVDWSPDCRSVAVGTLAYAESGRPTFRVVPVRVRR